VISRCRRLLSVYLTLYAKNGLKTGQVTGSVSFKLLAHFRYIRPIKAGTYCQKDRQNYFAESDFVSQRRYTQNVFSNFQFNQSVNRNIENELGVGN